MSRWSSQLPSFTLTFGGIALVLYVLEHINGVFLLNDFRVYYGAGEAMIGGGPLYGVAHGLDSGIFKYAPLLALFYATFALLPYGLAASVQYLLITLAMLDGMRRIDRLVRDRLLDGRATSKWPLFLTGLVCLVHFHRELHLGNINMMLLWLLVVSLEAMLDAKPIRAGLLLGVAILAKPHFVVLLPLLLLRRKWPTTGVALATILGGALLPAFFIGWEMDVDLHKAWLGEMAAHNASLFYTDGADHRPVNTVYSFLHRSVLQHMLGGPTTVEAYAILLAIAALIGLFVRNNLRRSRGERSFAFEFLLLVALGPCITVTDTEHFLLALPIVAYVMHHLLPSAQPRWLPYAAVPVLWAYGGNWEDALGPLSDRMIHYGSLGIGCLGLLIVSVVLFRRSNHSRIGASYIP